MRKFLPLKVSISGVRGIVGESLTPQLAARFASAFGTYLGQGQVLVGQDSRPSGLMLKKAVIAGLLATGCQPVEVGILPLPTILFLTRKMQARGAVVITASHNPSNWNGLKFISQDGLYLRSSEVEEFLDIFHQGEFTYVPAERIKPALSEKEAGYLHLRRIFSQIKVNEIKKRKFRLVADCANGAGATLLPRFLQELGAEVRFINTELSGKFAHQSEPTPENLKELGHEVRALQADLGLAQDADADRLALVDEQGQPLGEDATLTLSVDHVLSRKKGPIVVNLSSSMVIEDIARKYGVRVYRTKIGESNVVEKMLETRAVVGGEGNGGVIWPAVHPCRDSFTAAGLILEKLSSFPGSISQLMATYPRYYLLKDKFDCPAELAFKVVTELRRRYQRENTSTLDGLKIIWEEAWVHLRPSNTEPIMRIIAEARSPEKARQLLERFKGEIEQILKQMS
ncbi:MAG TPA: phosphoglucosamine mutase [Candidatus Saccharicenans sp.]|jgi:phosphomannomutase|nr:phosphoglucosamine mutase [Candidatus Saccharicenans sp.]HOL45606.1 phosphoglucosamine mutase [Candidatus Saccharicenans sp.]HOM94015.1 phosphoglucosamine mutase [Candidatus Saccharicenans sp.]HOT68604.1 phosphoglucosamine mutase [Candidatus Saccharicenans sp.]HPC87995.1 phosphoglucosamine mutase [Candidatus Saccharicenans sp.]